MITDILNHQRGVLYQCPFRDNEIAIIVKALVNYLEFKVTKYISNIFFQFYS